MADIKEGGSLLHDSADSQVVTLKALQELLNFHTPVILESIKRTVSNYKLQNNNDLLIGKEEEINQADVILEEKEQAVRTKMEVSTLETEVFAEASMQSTGKQHVDSLLQFDKYSDNLWFYEQIQYLRKDVTDYISKKSRNGSFKLKEITLRRERTVKIHQAQSQIQKLLKIKGGGGAMLKKKVLLKKDWKKYRKKRRMED